MKHRILGRTGREVSEIGMGLEHLLDKDTGVVVKTIKTALDGGVTYFDCHPGHDLKEGEVTYGGYYKLGKAINGCRDKLFLTYLASVSFSPGETRPRFEHYLRAVGTDHTDVFILQFCDKEAEYERMTSAGGLLSYAERLREEGKIKYVGISTHSTAIALRAIDSGAIDVLMYPVNPAFDVLTDGEIYKTDNLGSLWDAAFEFNAAGKCGLQPRRNLYVECERKGVAIVAMKPFGGGFIFNAEKDAGFTPVNLIAYALAQNGISTVAPGCTKPEEILEILSYYGGTDAERDYTGAVSKSRWSVNGNCQYCNHCLPCGADINIGLVNRLLDKIIFNVSKDSTDARRQYSDMPVKASACVECGACMTRCPFRVKVPDRMKQAVKLFEL